MAPLSVYVRLVVKLRQPVMPNVEKAEARIAEVRRAVRERPLYDPGRPPLNCCEPAKRRKQ